MTKYFTQYYGADWGGMLFTMVFLYLIGQKQRQAFLYGLLSNICWFIYALLSESAANAIANVIFAYLNIKGYIKWGKPESAKT